MSQCADISLAYLSAVRTAMGYVHPADEVISRTVPSSSFFIVLVRWLKGKVYAVEATKPTSPLRTTKNGCANKSSPSTLDTRLDPQPGYSCHMTKWNRMDSLDPSKITLEEAFHITQVSCVLLKPSTFHIGWVVGTLNAFIIHRTAWVVITL